MDSANPLLPPSQLQPHPYTHSSPTTTPLTPTQPHTHPRPTIPESHLVYNTPQLILLSARLSIPDKKDVFFNASHAPVETAQSVFACVCG